MKPLDFVKTKNGSIGMIVVTTNLGKSISIDFIYKVPPDYKNSWYDENELTLIGNLPHFLASNFCHFSSGRSDVDFFFKNDKKE